MRLTFGTNWLTARAPRNRRERRDAARFAMRFQVMSPEEVAEVCGLPLATVRRIQRGHSRAIYRSFKVRMYAHQADFYRLAARGIYEPEAAHVHIPRRIGKSPALAAPYKPGPMVIMSTLASAAAITVFREFERANMEAIRKSFGAERLTSRPLPFRLMVDEGWADAEAEAKDDARLSAVKAVLTNPEESDSK